MATDQYASAEVLAMPTAEQAAHFMREIEFGSRMGGQLLKSSGTSPVALYSLDEVASFLGKDNSNDAIEPGAKFLDRHVDVAYVNPEGLTGWIREVVGDVELADAMKVAVAQVPAGRGYPPAMHAMRELVSQRVIQCVGLLQPSGEQASDRVDGEDASN